MSQMYYYTKPHAINGVVLMDMIKLSSLKPKLESLKVVFNPDTDEMDTVEIYMIEVLQSTDEDILAQIINEYSPSYSLEARYHLENSLINPAMSYGREIIAKMGTNNVYLQKTDAQIQAISANFQPLIMDLLTGSLKQAYYKVLDIQPDANITQAELDEFKSRIGWFLGL